MATVSARTTDPVSAACEELRAVLADAEKEEEVDVLVEYVGAARAVYKNLDDAIQARRGALSLKERVEVVREKTALKKLLDALVGRVENAGGDLSVLSAVDALVGADLVPVKVEAAADTLGSDRAPSVADSATTTGARKRAASSEHAEGALAGLKVARVEEDAAGTADAEGEDDPATLGPEVGTPPPVGGEQAETRAASAGAAVAAATAPSEGEREVAAAAAETERAAEAERVAEAGRREEAEGTTDTGKTETGRREEADGTAGAAKAAAEAEVPAEEPEAAVAVVPLWKWANRPLVPAA
ncbi:hypothetical protein DFH11DRAFT_1732826 [Phellopilus nigrolimitatus]|nr:hypothetical protein DFH11DRAFT_1732826 [Phellopilus nigrolimitatus]